MKKSIVALLLLLAVIVLVSPGIVGRIAERTMQQDLELATGGNDDVVITSTGFRRGWFSSAGRHRIEPAGDGWMFAGEDQRDADRQYITALLIDTEIDHGLIPLSSLAREQGSLMPGLGSAVSTVSIEFADGTSAPLPGAIYSKLALNGELRSNLLVDADSVDVGRRLFAWGGVDLHVSSQPATGAVTAAGGIDSLSLTSPLEVIRAGALTVSADQRPGPFGFWVGTLDIELASAAIESPVNNFTLGPLELRTSVDVRGERIDTATQFRLAGVQSEYGLAGLAVQTQLSGADGRAAAEVLRALRELRDDDSMSADALADPGAGLQRLLAAGLGLRIERFELTLPQGDVSTTVDLVIRETDIATFSWAGILLATEGHMELHASPGFVDLATSIEPSLGTAVALGYLRREGDRYVTRVELRSGVLTINGAPMNIPLGGF